MKKIDVIQPVAMASVFAEGVYSATSTNDFEIPAATSTGDDDTCVLDDGFLPITSTALDDGGMAPERKNFNGMFYLSTDLRFNLQNGCLITYNPAVATAIGGYPQNAILAYFDSNNTFGLVQSLIDDNTNNFVSNPSLIDGIHWQAITLDGANKDLSNLTSTGESRLHALKSYEDSGELLTDSEGLADVMKYAHSTFDVSKFTIEGSLAITDDGIASGFSATKYVTANLTFTPANQLKYCIKITTSNDVSTGQCLLRFYNNVSGSNNTNAIYITNSKIRFQYADSGTTDSTFTVLPNTTYWLSLEWLDGKYYFNYSTDGVNYSQATSPITNANVMSGNNSPIIIGTLNSTSFGGSIDLKDFSVVVDGVPVFSGNKTGIDTIKPDDYTVVGSPTISGGIASGFTTSNYITFASDTFRPGSNPWKISAKVRTPATIGTAKTVCALNYTGSGSTYGVNIGIPSSAGINFYCSDSTGTNIFAQTITGITGNTDYLLELEFTGTKYICYVNGVNKYEYASTAIIYQSNSRNNYIGVRWEGASIERFWGGSIDLNAFKIYVDGDLVYQPCLKIPYTESKTGSKVVDSCYRDRVNDMYTQFGYAPYYTLQENTNFTIPQGELYGMMLNQSTPHIIERYTNGTSWYRVWSDGWCEQGGGISASTGSITAVVFLKEFADTNYYNNVIYEVALSSCVPRITDKATTGFNIANDAFGSSFPTGIKRWMACGYIN